tara:strand:- start:1306 stop:1725 length:420 start_codon:yes stop_codon:yes gene_type:complete
MELFLFILSFISGGVVLTVTYTAVLSFRNNRHYTQMEEYMNTFQEDVEKMGNHWRRDLRVVSDNHQKIKEQLEADHYKDLSNVNKELEKLNRAIEKIEVDREVVRKRDESTFTDIYNNIQRTVKMINDVKEDQRLNQNY